MYHSLYSFTDQDFRYAYQESNSDFASKNEYLLSLQFFLKNIPSGEELILLGSSDGLVLCHTPNLYNKYHVCNPLTRSWVSLPPPPAQDSTEDTEDIEEYEDNADVGGIYCYNSSESSNRCYKVVRVQEFDLGTKKLKVDVYSSDLGVWESFQVSCDRIVTFNGEPDTQEYAFVKSSNSQIRIVRGVIYWIAATKLLICNLNQSGEHLCEYIDMPRDDRGEDWETCAWVLWESEGSVGVAKASEGTVSVWRVSRYFELQEPCYWEELYWKVSLEPVFEIVRSREKQLPDSIGLTGILPDSIVLIGISHVDHNVVLLYRCPWVWGFNLITRAVEELCLSNKEIAAIRCPFVLKPMTTNV